MSWFLSVFTFTFSTQPKNADLVEGDYHALKASASRQCSYQWYKDGRLIPGATNGEYRIFYMLEGDRGRYVATARSGNRIISSSAALVSYQPLISVVITNGMVSMTPAKKNSQIRYTINGNEPTSTSQLYTRPFRVDSDCTLRAAVGNVEMDSIKIKAQKNEKIWKR